jgi:putative PEP-CTERM system histidine kinase
VSAGLASYATGALLFLALSFVLATGWRGRLQGALLLFGAMLTALWAAAAAGYAGYGWPGPGSVQVLEVARNVAWLSFLLHALRGAHALSQGTEAGLRVAAVAVAVLCAGTVVLVLIQHLGGGHAGGRLGANALVLGHLLQAVAGLALVEQFFRNTRPEQRWRVKFLCLGIGAMFAYDFFLYSDALLFRQIDAHLWDARGAVNALMAPLIAVAAARNPQWSLDVFVSRGLVLHTTTLVAAGIYLLVMAAAGYYIRAYGGTWGAFAQIVFLSGAGLVLLVLMFSGQLRARLKVFVSKHFFNYKYDYREEWLRFIGTLAGSEREEPLPQRTVRAMAQIVESPGGMLWLREAEQFAPVACRNVPEPQALREPAGGRLTGFLAQNGWVIDLEQLRRDPGAYADLPLPDWLDQVPGAWLIVPLLQQEQLLGFVVLTRSRARVSLNWEDYDLLKTAGRQAASHLAQMLAARALAEARQFEGFNRLSAFVVHDLKNLVAQLSLVAHNAQRFKHKPGFIDDAVDTVEHSVARMSRLLAQLRAGRSLGPLTPIDLREALQAAVRNRASERPVPQIAEAVSGVGVLADPDRLVSVFEHLIHNAQQATSGDGSVCVRLRTSGSEAIVEVEDNGCGMDAAFVRERLFRPFDTTKGNAGMGIGAFESRELVRALGGDVQVDSSPGRGTIFRILLPVAHRAHTLQTQDERRNSRVAN